MVEYTTFSVTVGRTTSGVISGNFFPLKKLTDRLEEGCSRGTSFALSTSLILNVKFEESTVMLSSATPNVFRNVLK